MNEKARSSLPIEQVRLHLKKLIEWMDKHPDHRLTQVYRPKQFEVESNMDMPVTPVLIQRENCFYKKKKGKKHKKKK